MHDPVNFQAKAGVALCLLLLLLLAGCGGAVSHLPPAESPSFGDSATKDSPCDPTLSLPPSDPAVPSGSDSPTTHSSKADDLDPTAFSARSEGDGGTVAVWWWDKGKAARLNRGKYLDFLEKNCVNEIYICWPNFNSEQLASFVTDAGERGMAVSLLSGDASWIDPQNNGADAVINEFLEYQRHAEPHERLMSLHMDVEPHQREDFSSNRQEILQWYADFVKKTAKKVQGQGEKIGWDIPFWFDEFAVLDENGKETPLLCHLAEHADTLCLMSYRDSAEAVLDCARKELQLAREYGCQIICGVETHSAEGDHVSFMEEGKDYMASETGKLYLTLKETMPKDQYGIAFHYLDTWYKLQD